MRILSQHEVASLGLEVDTLPDESQRWLTVMGKIPKQAGSYDSDEKHYFKTQACSLIERMLCGNFLEMRIRTRSLFDTSFTHSTVEEVVIFFQLPIDLILFPRQLAEYGIEPKTGQFVIAVPPYKAPHFRRRNILDHETHGELNIEWDENGDMLYSLEPEMRLEEAEFEYLLNAKEIPVKGRTSATKRYLRHDGFGGRAKRDGKVYSQGEEFDRRMLSDLREGSLHHPLRMFVTPFEFPAGFVRETARVIREEFSSNCPEFITTFHDMAFRPYDLSQQKTLSEELEFPYGEPALEGPDVFWKYCAHPSWIEAILLARLIGGESWNYVLGNLEARYGESMDWNAPVEVALRTA